MNQIASSIVDALDRDKPREQEPERNPHAVALGRLGGLKGGPARANKLSPIKRKNIARKAAQTRWKERSNVD